MTMNTNKSTIALLIAAMSLAVSAGASAKIEVVGRSSDAFPDVTEDDPTGLDPMLDFVARDNDIDGAPVGYIDIPEIDRVGDNDEDGDETGEAHAPDTGWPGDIFSPITTPVDPFLLPGLSGIEFDFYDFGLDRSEPVGVPVASNIPAPGATTLGLLGAAALMRRRREA